MKLKLRCNSTCAFTGHRPQKLDFGFDEADPRCLALKGLLRRCILRLITGHQVRHFISGMALGTDLWAAETVLDLRARHGLTLTAALPCPSQPDKWRPEQRRRYEALLGQCDGIHYVSRRYTPDCFRQRNEYMVDHATYLLGVYDPQIGGGAGQTIAYAARQGINLIQIHPRTLEVTAIMPPV